MIYIFIGYQKKEFLGNCKRCSTFERSILAHARIMRARAILYTLLMQFIICAKYINVLL